MALSIGQDLLWDVYSPMGFDALNLAMVLKLASI